MGGSDLEKGVRVVHLGEFLEEDDGIVGVWRAKIEAIGCASVG